MLERKDPTSWLKNSDIDATRENSSQVNEKVNERVNERQKKIISAISSNPYVTQSELASTLGISLVHINKNMKKLQAQIATPRPTWYGRISVKGRLRYTNLNVPIEGEVPLNGKGAPVWNVKGDCAFERSKRAARRAFDRWRNETKKDPAELAAKAFKARTGISVEGVPLAKLADLWESQNRTYTPTENWRRAVRRWFGRFCSFARNHAAENGARCETINDVTAEIARAWFAHLKVTFAWETVTKQMSLMRNSYRRYATGGRFNPFEDVVMRNRDVANARVSRKPLSATETQRLFDCVHGNDKVYPLVVAAACTGMRIGDVCRLKWHDVDLDEGLIDVQTAKTGRRVTIPIFERLREVLRERNAMEGDGRVPSMFVFPAAARWYEENPSGVYQAVKPYIGRAVFGDAPNPSVAMLVEDGNGDVRPRSLADAIGEAHFTDAKRIRIMEVYTRFKKGMRCGDIATALGVARSQVSMDLREAERLTGETLRPLTVARSRRATNLELIKLTRAPRGVGKRAASLYGWHSLRATFVVLAVEAGVPLPEVQQIVGHTTTEMTMQYFNPERKHTAERVQQRMRGTVLDGECARGGLIDATTPTATSRISLDEVLAALTDEQRKELASRLLLGS